MHFMTKLNEGLTIKPYITYLCNYNNGYFSHKLSIVQETYSN
jgi:hypothetical protein